ncbi:MAG: hypothetical protein AAF677_03900 [Pseudomonadota bacterium]
MPHLAMPAPPGTGRSIARGLTGFAADQRGAINLEFMLWLPILLIWTFGAVAAFDGFKSRNNAAKASYTVADILSRKIAVDDAQMAELFALQRAVLPQAPRTGQVMRAASILYDGSAYIVDWTWSSDTTRPLDAEDIPFDIMPLMGAGSSVTFVEIFVPYRPLTGLSAFGDRLWHFELFTRPRLRSKIEKTDSSAPVTMAMSAMPLRLRDPEASIALLMADR